MKALSPETSFLVQKLRSAEPGQLITFSEFGDAINDDIRKPRNRSKLSQAIEIVMRDYGIVFLSQHGVGYRRTEQNDIAMIAEEKGIAGTKRVINRWKQQIDSIDYEHLSPKGKAAYAQSATKCALVEAATTPELYQSLQPTLKATNMFKPSKEDAIAALTYGVS